MSAPLHLDAANIFVGDGDPTKSLFLVIKNVKLPTLEEITKTHLGGGAIDELEIGMGAIKAPMLTFQLDGFNPETLVRFMPGTPRRIKYTIRHNVWDVREQANKPLVAVVEGRMSKVETSEFDKEKGVTEDYEIKEVAFYKMEYDGAEKIYYDYFLGPNGIRMNGVATQADVAANIGLA